MIARLGVRNFMHRPARSAFLLLGYGIGVAVMIVLLSIGEALLSQARDERLVGGGTITVLPEGLNVEVMKTGGLGGLFFSIGHARFIYLQLLAAPRLAQAVDAVAPQIEGKLLYLRAGNREYAVRATGEIPSRGPLVGAPAPVALGVWEDDALDRRWIDPTPAELRAEIDRFHLPPARLEAPESWAEWHYFNVLTANGRRWAFISFIVAGEIPGGRWGGRVLLTVHEQGGEVARYVADAPSERVRFSTTDPDLRIGSSTVTLREDGSYHVRARAREEDGTGVIEADFVLFPAPRAYFPGASLGGDEFVSGYVVPALRASATGRWCSGGRCERFEEAQAYHDHNWGVWRGVTWEWGATRAGAYTVLYGQVQPPDDAAATAPLFVYVVDSLGFLAIFRPADILYEDRRVVRVNGRTILVPATALIADARGDDTLRLELTIEDAVATDTRRPLVERGDRSAAPAIGRPYFVQMKGRARLSGRIQGIPLEGEGEGFFETYRP